MKFRFTNELFLYLLIFALGAGLRLHQLGLTSLSEYEAVWALRAWEAFQGSGFEIGPNPAYVLLTGLTFFVAGSSDALARLWPALAGSLLVALPFLFRDRLGRSAGLLLALGLAVDPGLVALSKLAGGPMLALSFGLLALGCWWAGWAVLAGVLAGLALLSGPAVLAGAVGLALAYMGARALGLLEDGTMSPQPESGPPLDNHAVRSGLLAFGGTLLVAGTLFLRFPQGIGALGAVFPAYFLGWTAPSGIPARHLLLALVIYQPLALVFGLVGLRRSWSEGSRTGQALGIWFMSALALALLYPGRIVGDVVWALVPLWALAAGELARYFRKQPVRDAMAWALAGVIVVLLASVWVNLAGLSLAQPGTQTFTLRLVVMVGAVMLVILSTLLIGLGWSPAAAARGLVYGVSVTLFAYVLAGSWAAAPRFATNQQDLWGPGVRAGDIRLVVETLGDLGEWTAGRRDSLDIVVRADAPSLRWAFRELPVRFDAAVGLAETPSVIITWENEPAQSLAIAYRGQDFDWRVYPVWDAMTRTDWLKWVVSRTTPTVPDKIILWAREDLFPGGTLDIIKNLENAEPEFAPDEDSLDPDDPFK